MPYKDRNACNAKEAHEIGLRLMDWLNGALFVRHVDRKRMTPGIILERDADGAWSRGIALMTGTAHVRSRASAVAQVIGPDGVVVLQPPPPHARWLELAAKDSIAGDVLTHLSGELGWFDIYKALELMRDDLNRAVGFKKYGEIGWPDISRFSASAQVHRHARSDWPQGYDLHNAMPLADARRLVRELAEKWLNWRASRT